MRRAALVLAALLSLTILPGCFSGPPQILSVQPSRGSNNVPADAPVTVVFDQAIQASSIVHRFRVTPAIPGCSLSAAFSNGANSPCYIQWLTNQPGFELRHPSAVFSANTKYVFHLDSGIVGDDGIANSLSHSWDVTSVAAPTVSTVSVANHQRGVAIDLPISVVFSQPMDPGSAADAIHLTPNQPGTRVTVNSHDPTRFVLVPGHLLHPDSSYQLTVSNQARGIDHQRIASGVDITFISGRLSGQPHAAVMSGSNGIATSASLAALAVAVPGDPPVVQNLLSVGPTVALTSVALSAGSRWLAVGEVDETHPTAPIVAVFAVPTMQQVAILTNASLPAWGVNGALAYASGATLGVINAAQPSTPPEISALPSPAVDRPAWAGSDTIAVTVTVAAQPVIDLISVGSDAVYPAPGLPSAYQPVASSDGTVAAAEAAGTRGVAFLNVSTGVVQSTGNALTPIGFGLGDDILARGSAGIVQISRADGSISPLGAGPSGVDDNAAVVVPGGRQIAWLAPQGNATQVFVSNADGSNGLAVTSFAPGVDAIAMSVAGT